MTAPQHFTQHCHVIYMYDGTNAATAKNHVGYLEYHRIYNREEQDDLFITWLWVEAKYRGKGYGRGLVGELKERARHLRCRIRVCPGCPVHSPSDTEATPISSFARFWKHMGFTPKSDNLWGWTPESAGAE